MHPDTDNSSKRSGIRLNKFVAHCGVASRRKAAQIVKSGRISVNGIKECNPSYMVQPTDQVYLDSKLILPEKKRIYLLLNKPKNIITSMADDRGRTTVRDLIKDQYPERIYPVGRLDRMTTGLLLLTNDGQVAQKLAHPKYKIKKVYHVVLDKALQSKDRIRIAQGLELEDGTAQVDQIEYVQGRSKKEIGIELHLGKNRIIRRIFEALDYKVIRLDRTYYAGLTKKDLPRGHYRPLTEQEIIMIKHFI